MLIHGGVWQVVANMLPCYEWDVDKLVKEWFKDSEAVFKHCGISNQEVTLSF